MNLMVIAQENWKDHTNTIENILYSRSQRIEDLFSDVRIQIANDLSNIIVRHHHNVIQTFAFQKEAEISIEKIVSFFLNLEELLTIQKALKTSQKKEIQRIEIIEALYEYPFVDKQGHYFVYISNKGTGNRNPIVMDLVNYQERQIIIPETGDYFPVLINDILYFLMTVKEGFSLVAFDLEGDNWIELKRGKITCLRSHSDSIYYSEENNIYKLDSKANILDGYEFEQRIQSFDISENLLIISMLVDNQYDLFAYRLADKRLVQITNTDSNEMDVVFKEDKTIIFSSNQMGHYGIYELDLDTLTFIPEYRLIYAEKNTDLFYPFYSNIHRKIICTLYETGKEPKFLIIPH